MRKMAAFSGLNNCTRDKAMKDHKRARATFLRKRSRDDSFQLYPLTTVAAANR